MQGTVRCIKRRPSLWGMSVGDNSHISTGEILQDIKDTQDEIAQMEKEVTAFRMLDDRMSHFRADARISGIAERKQFIKKLEKILAERRGEP
jgi:hypothetical protein